MCIYIFMDTTKIDIVNKIYNEYLHRDVDPDGIKSYYKYTNYNKKLREIDDNNKPRYRFVENQDLFIGYITELCEIKIKTKQA